MALQTDDLARLEAGWPETHVIDVDAAAVEQIADLAVLRTKGYEFRWVPIQRVRSLTLSGWEVAFAHQANGRAIFMNRVSAYLKAAQNLVLIMRNPGDTSLPPYFSRGSSA